MIFYIGRLQLKFSLKRSPIQRVHLRTEDASWLKGTKLFQLWIKEMTPTVDNNATSIRTKQEL